jgi:hypothetical protein
MNNLVKHHTILSGHLFRILTVALGARNLVHTHTTHIHFTPHNNCLRRILIIFILKWEKQSYVNYLGQS